MDTLLDKYTGSCHCGNISVVMHLAGNPGAYAPRACDCDFCRKHAAAYLSDPQGKLAITVRDADRAGHYRQGSGSAEFLLCTRCGVLIGVCYAEAGRRYAAVNVRILDEPGLFAAETPVSPRLLAVNDKIARWKAAWFADVSIGRADTRNTGPT